MKRTYTTLPYTEYSTTAYDANRAPIDKIVIHSTVCTTQAAINTFSSPNAQTSAHYIIGNDGKLWAGLEEYNVAYHSGSYPMNQRSIGIEHEWYSGIHPSDALYAKSAALVKDICNFYNLSINSSTVIPHKQVVATGCPNEIDVNKIISLANGTPVVDECPAKLTQITAERDRLNGIITGKDETISHLGDTINAKNAELATLQGMISNLNSQVITLKEQLATATEQALKVPALTEQLASCEQSKLLYQQQVSALQTQIGKIKASLVPKKYLSLKIYKFIMALE